MTTTSSTTSTSAAASSILTSLGAGSGIDTSSLVDQLVTAQYSTKTSALSTKYDALTTRLSDVADLMSSITSFSNALNTLIRGGTLSTQPTSSDESILKVALASGASISDLSSQVEVRQLASPQVVSSTAVASASTAIGTGTLTLNFGTATVEDGAMTAFTGDGSGSIDIDITSDNSSLQGIADAINAADAGVTASILTDADGARLVLKSVNGSDQAFTLTATEDGASPGLSALNIGVGATGTTINKAASDAIVAVDGVVVRRTSNTLRDVIPGVTLTLASASPGTTVTVGSEEPTDALSQAVTDFVDTYNQMIAKVKEYTDPKTGDLKADSAAKTLLDSLRGLTLTTLVSDAASGVPNSLSGIGVSTNRDGTLSVDSTRLTTVLATYPGSVEAMFQTGSGLSKALGTIATTATNTTYGLGASKVRYTKQQSDTSEAQDKLSTQEETTRTRLTQLYSSMDAKVAAYKSTQTFLQQQIDAWNNSNN